MQQMFLHHFVPACTFRPYNSTRVLKLFRTFTGKMTRRLSLLLVFNLLFEETVLTRKRKWYKKILGKSDVSKNKNKKHVWLSGRLHIEGRLNEGQRLRRRKHKDENEAKQNKRNTRERRHDICKPNARRAQVRATCG